jgi:cytochrome P450
MIDVDADTATVDVLAEFGSTEFRNDPYPLLDWLGEKEPVHKTTAGFYLVSRHADAEHALKQSGETFHGLFGKGVPSAAESPFAKHPSMALLAESVLSQDPRAHTRPIPAGADVRPVFAAANRDPRVFADPDKFIPERDNSSALAFGAGIHKCLGIFLAREEMSTALPAIHRQLPHIAAEVTQWGDYRNLRAPASTRVSAH